MKTSSCKTPGTLYEISWNGQDSAFEIKIWLPPTVCVQKKYFQQGECTLVENKIHDAIEGILLEHFPFAMAVKPKPTVEGLEALLRDEDGAVAFVMPNGSVVRDQAAACIEDLAGRLRRLSDLIGNLTGSLEFDAAVNEARATLTKWGLK